MRTLLAVLGLCGLLLMPLPDVADGGPFKNQTSGLGLLVWEAPSGTQDGQRRALFTGAIDGRASLLTAGDQGAGDESADEAVRRGQNHDRGPYGGGKRRIIDLSEAAAQQVGLLEHGTERVEVVVVKNAS